MITVKKFEASQLKWLRLPSMFKIFIVYRKGLQVKLSTDQVK